MDELKLEKWKENFNEEARKLEIEFATFFRNKKLNEHSELKLDESSEFFIETKDDLPQNIKERLMKLLITTKSEDSI